MDTNRRTWYEVSTAIGSLPPLTPMPMPLVKKFDSEAEAVEWAERFRGFPVHQNILIVILIAAIAWDKYQAMGIF